MSEGKKDLIEENIEDKNSDWDGSTWVIVLLMLLFGCDLSGRDAKDNELRERVARLEGQMDIVSRRDK